MKDFLILLKHSPYRNGLSKLALDLAITFATFEQRVSILIIADGCLQLYPDQKPETFGLRNQMKTLASLNLYDIKNIYIESSSLHKIGFDTSALDEGFKVINRDSAKQLVNNSDYVIGF